MKIQCEGGVKKHAGKVAHMWMTERKVNLSERAVFAVSDKLSANCTHRPCENPKTRKIIINVNLSVY
jgi:hypothetical protein